SREELLTLDVDTLLRRLFWQENVRVFEPRQARFRCACSRERVRAMLVGLGREEIEDIIAERGDVEVGCDFCGLHYYFDAVDVGEMFAPTQDQQPGPGTLQ
ncbi:MAG: Hsp33 family molecular chaperone HslO, partial [Gammaproteobacteria bacterium]